jgi:hypothetical protein
MWSRRGFDSQQFWHGLRIALNLDGVIGYCPLMAPSSFAFSSWDGMSADWGYQLRPNRPVFDLFCASPELISVASLSKRMQADQIWFALTRRRTLDRGVNQVIERAGQVVTVNKKGSLIALPPRVIGGALAVWPGCRSEL